MAYLGGGGPMTSAAQGFTGLPAQRVGAFVYAQQNPIPGASDTQNLAAARFGANAPYAPMLMYHRARRSIIDSLNKQGAADATASARMQRGSAAASMSGGRSTGGNRGSSMLLSLLGLMAPPNSTTSKLGGGA